MKTVKQNTDVVNALNQLLADHQVYYQNLRGLHWNVKGSMFFALHAKFEEMYNQAAETVDAIAERILMVGGEPLHTMKSMLAQAQIEEKGLITDGKSAVDAVLSDSEQLLKEVQSVMEVAARNSDEGTQVMLSEWVPAYEKQIWMLKAFLG